MTVYFGGVVISWGYADAIPKRSTNIKAIGAANTAKSL